MNHCNPREDKGRRGGGDRRANSQNQRSKKQLGKQRKPERAKAITDETDLKKDGLMF